MVAKATAQRQEICSALVDATTHLLVMLPLPLDSDRARLATDPFGPRPEHPDRALKREEAPATARDLPTSPNLSTCAIVNYGDRDLALAHLRAYRPVRPPENIGQKVLGMHGEALMGTGARFWRGGVAH